MIAYTYNYYLVFVCIRQKNAVFLLIKFSQSFNFPRSLGYIRKLTFGSPWGNYFTTGFVCSQETAPWNINLAQSLPSQG